MENIEDVYWKYYVMERMTISEIAEKFGIGRSTLGKKFNDRGLLTSNDEGFEYLNPKFNIYAFDEFSDEMAYWLGFIYADGSIHKDSNFLSLALNSVDFDHVSKFNKFMKSEDDVKFYKGSNGKIDYELARVGFSSNHLKNRLNELGVVSNKSRKDIDMLDKIPEEFIISFIIGYFDGDGSVSLSNSKKYKEPRLAITGSNKNVVSMGNYLVKNKIINRFYHDECKSFGTISWVDKESILRFYNYYKKSYVNLGRKFEKFKEVIDNYMFMDEVREELKKERRSKWARKEDLEVLIYKKSFLEIGRLYEVSGNTVANWCKAYGLPYKRRDIKKL